jgi:ankyrin repeat protein
MTSEFEARSNALVIAVKDGTYDTAKILLRQGNLDINAPFSGKFSTPLTVAAMNERENIVPLLLEHGADVNKKDGENGKGQTPLIAASRSSNDRTVIVELLVEKGARLDEKDERGNTALVTAVERENKDIVRFLVESGAALDEKNNEGDTALTIAARQNYAEIVQKLVDAGASLDVKNGKGRAPLEEAQWEEEEEGGFCAESMQILKEALEKSRLAAEEKRLAEEAAAEVARLAAMHGRTANRQRQLKGYAKKINLGAGP